MNDILADIRLRLKAFPESRLDGPNGVVQATMNAWDAAEKDAEKGWSEVKRLRQVLKDVAELSVQDVDSRLVWHTLGRIERIARKAVEE